MTPSELSRQEKHLFAVHSRSRFLRMGRLALGAGTAQDKTAAGREVDRLSKVLLELDEYEHDVLFPLAIQQLAIDLDDGVKANYPKFGTALNKIPGLEASDE
jgi:hypothetical protein